MEQLDLPLSGVRKRNPLFPIEHFLANAKPSNAFNEIYAERLAKRGRVLLTGDWDIKNSVKRIGKDLPPREIFDKAAA